MSKPILDACCGSRMFWFDKQNPTAEFVDNRVVERHEFYPGRFIEIRPDTVADFANLPYPDKSFKLVVFDPPHLVHAGKSSWLAMKYGRLPDGWQVLIHDGFWECMRVLDDYGVLIFKWNETDIPVKEVLACTDQVPVFGHRSGKASKTHWMTFMKGIKSC